MGLTHLTIPVNQKPSKSNFFITYHLTDPMVRRRFLDKNGAPADYSLFKQGDLVVAEITVKAVNESLDNVAVIDMLPAGFEIENPRLQSRKRISWIGDKAYSPMYMDIWIFETTG